MMCYAGEGGLTCISGAGIAVVGDGVGRVGVCPGDGVGRVGVCPGDEGGDQGMKSGREGKGSKGVKKTE